MKEMITYPLTKDEVCGISVQRIGRLHIFEIELNNLDINIIIDMSPHSKVPIFMYEVVKFL